MTFISPSYKLVDYLLSLSSTIQNLLADTDTTWGRLIFRDALPLTLNRSGKRAIIASNNLGGMYSGSSAYGAQISIRLYADHTRDSEGLARVEDGVDRAWTMFGWLESTLRSAPIISRNPFVQLERSSQPLETYDQQENVPYIAVQYDTAVLATP